MVQTIALVLQLVDLIFVIAQLALEQFPIRVAAASGAPRQRETERGQNDGFHIRLMRKIPRKNRRFLRQSVGVQALACRDSPEG